MDSVVKGWRLTRIAAFNLMGAGKLPKPLGRVGRTWVFGAGKVGKFLAKRKPKP
jgi:hypothetical protein